MRSGYPTRKRMTCAARSPVPGMISRGRSAKSRGSDRMVNPR
jgi:hypothetical protein